MFKSDNLKSFIMSRVFGLFSLIIAIFLFLNLIRFNESDATFGNLTSSLTALNYLGTYGAHISGFFLATLHYSSYLIPVFFSHHWHKINFWHQIQKFFYACCFFINRCVCFKFVTYAC